MPCRTKTSAIGVIVSLLVCCEFGFLSKVINAPVLEKVNKLQENKNQTNEDASIDVYDRKNKPVLESNPLCRMFDYEKQHEGY